MIELVEKRFCCQLEVAPRVPFCSHVGKAKYSILALQSSRLSNGLSFILERTNAPAVDVGHSKPTTPHFRIIGGFLCLDKCWKVSIATNKPFGTAVKSAAESNFIDIGYILNDRSCVAEMDLSDHLHLKVNISFGADNETLIYLFLKLVASLQKLGTVRPIDLNRYIDKLNSQ